MGEDDQNYHRNSQVYAIEKFISLGAIYNIGGIAMLISAAFSLSMFLIPGFLSELQYGHYTPYVVTVGCTYTAFTYLLSVVFSS